jgi:acyl transferase domain-containing protein
VESYEPAKEDLDARPSVPQVLGPLVISAQSSAVLMKRIQSLSRYLQSEPSVDFDNLTTILQLHRTVFTVRASFVGATAECLAEFMNAYVQQQTDAKTPSRRDSHGPPQILGIFTGQGAQWPQMGRELVLTSPVFADCLSELQRSLDTLPDCPSWSLREELLAEDALSRVHDPVVGQPLCTAVQIGLVNLLHSAGLKFNKVVGHSSGEIAAAYAGGFLSAADAIRVSYYRGLHVENECSNSGAMAAVQMAYSEAQELCQSGCFAGRVVVAASNAPSIVTLSGDADAIQEIKELLADTTPMKQLHVNHAYHSHHMNRAAESYAKSLRACKIEVHSGRPDCAWISSVKPGMTIQTDRMLQVSYWVENLIKPVLFSQAVTEVVCDPCTIDAIFEVGPHPALQAPVAQIVRENGGRAIHYDALLQRGHASTETFAKALGELWVHLGADAHIDFAGFHKAFAKKIPSAVQRARLLDALPGYPWDHQRLYWKESRISANYRLHSNPRHCLLGHRRPDDSKHDMRWRNILRLNEVPWLRGHSFQGEAVFPAAGYISMAVDASQSLVSDGCGMTVEIRDLEILHALVLRDDLVGMEVLFSLQVNPASDIGTVTASFVCASGLSRPDADFRVNARGQVSISVNKTGLASDAVLPLRTQMLRAMLAIDSTQLYRTLGALGLEYSGLFRALVDVQRTTRMSTARASWSSSELDSSMRIHPAVLDTGFQAIFASVGSVMGLHHPYLPTSIAKIRVKVPPVDFRLETDVDIMIETYVTEVARRPSDWMPVIAADLDIFSDKQYRVQVEGLTLTPMSAAEPANDRKIYYQTVWEDDISNSLQLQSIENGYERKGSLDDTELPELLERLSHIYLREIFASVSPEKITTFEWYHQRFFEYMKDLFTCIDQGRHPIIKQQWTRDTKQLLFTEISRFPETIDLICVNTVARHMPDVLAGKLSMLEVLAENDKLTRLYDEGLMTSRVYSCITQMARQLSHRYPRLRVLEIGAGTGATTRRVLEGLQGAFSTYVYSDISAGFFEKAKTHITHWAGKMEFRTFDIEQDPDGQGLPTHTYDLVIASSVLHATRFVRKSLAHTRRLLRPGGYLLLLEPTSCSVRVPYLMGGLPGWWLGGEDGRRLHPGLTPIQWDQAMRNVGFSGIDNLCSDTDEPTKHIYSLMATQALDDRVTMLREPLSALKSLPKPTQLLIIGGQTLPVSRLVSKLSTLLAQWQRSIVFVASLEALSSSIDVLQGATVLCLADLDQPIFQSITASIFHSLQKLFNHAGRVLWVTKHCHTNSPYSNMMIGLVRVLSNEMVHLDVQMLDLQNSHLNLQSHAYDIAHALIRLSMKESLGDDVLWSTEPELALRDGTLRIPRLRQDQALNDRLNANWRYILTKAPMEGQIFQLSHQHRRWSIDLQDSPPGRRQSIEGGETFTIQMDLSSLHPVEIYPGMSLYVGIGLVQTTGEKVVTLARSNASFITTCRNWTWPCVAPEHEQEQNLNSIIAALLSQRILLSMAKDTTLLLIHSSTSQLIAQKLTHMARSRGVQVSCMTSQGSLPENGQDCIQIHPYATMRQVRTILPRNVTRAVSLAVTRQNRENQHILACLPSYVETIELSSYLKDRSQVDLGLDAPTVESFVTTVIREAQACPHSSSTIELFPLSSPSSIAMRSDVPRSSIVDWRGEVSYPVTVRPLAPGNLLSTDKTYFLVGLTGELGKSLARWMIIHGARYLVLSSRRGLVDAVWLEEMHNMGAHVIVYAMDVTEFSSLKSVYEKVQRIMPPIGGVVNGAMVLADALFTDMTFEALVTALRPKVDGSRNLDSLFRGPDLEFFILLSSVSAVTGFRGQSNYAAGNMFMAGLVAQRRSQGLVGSVLDLGMLAELGYVARAGAAMQEYLQHKYSITPIYEPDFHQMFAEAIVAGRPNSPHLHEIITGVQALQVDQILDRTPWLDNPRFSHLLLRDTNVTSQTTSSQGIPIAHMMTNAQNRDEAVSALQAGLVARLSTILQIDPSEVSLQLPLVNIGVDSLVAIDIRSWLIRELKLDIPALRIVGGITLIELADEVVTKLFWKEGAMHENSQSPSEQETREKSADAPEVDGTHSGEGKTTDSQSSDALTFMSTGKSDEAVVSETQASIFIPTIKNCIEWPDRLTTSSCSF